MVIEYRLGDFGLYGIAEQAICFRFIYVKMNIAQVMITLKIHLEPQKPIKLASKKSLSSSSIIVQGDYNVGGVAI